MKRALIWKKRNKKNKSTNSRMLENKLMMASQMLQTINQDKKQERDLKHSISYYKIIFRNQYQSIVKGETIWINLLMIYVGEILLLNKIELQMKMQRRLKSKQLSHQRNQQINPNLYLKKRLESHLISNMLVIKLMTMLFNSKKDACKKRIA